MPVILDSSAYDLGLDPGMQKVDAASELLRPCDARLMRCYPVSTRINYVANDDEGCSAPVEFAQVQDRLGAGNRSTPESYDRSPSGMGGMLHYDREGLDVGQSFSTDRRVVEIEFSCELQIVARECPSDCWRELLYLPLRNISRENPLSTFMRCASSGMRACRKQKGETGSPRRLWASPGEIPVY